jgi:hypothetical protein
MGSASTGGGGSGKTGGGARSVHAAIISAARAAREADDRGHEVDERGFARGSGRTCDDARPASRLA